METSVAASSPWWELLAQGSPCCSYKTVETFTEQ